MKRLFQLQGKRFTAALTVLLLSVSQLAVAMHACSPMKTTSSSTHHAVESGRDCDCPVDHAESDTSSDAALCKQHCESGQQNLSKPFVADQVAQVAVASTPSITYEETGLTIVPIATDRVATSPRFLRNAILRI